jgi:CRP-like cAMP-binding protein
MLSDMRLIDLFKHSSTKRKFAVGELIFSEGEPGDNLYVILEGKVEIVAMRQVFEVAGPGDIIGEMALIEPGPRTAAARVVETCVAAVVDEKEFLFMTKKMPDFSLYVMRVLVRRLKEMDLKFN